MPAGIVTPATSTSVVVMRGIAVCTMDSQRRSSSIAARWRRDRRAPWRAVRGGAAAPACRVRACSTWSRGRRAAADPRCRRARRRCSSSPCSRTSMPRMSSPGCLGARHRCRRIRARLPLKVQRSGIGSTGQPSGAAAWKSSRSSRHAEQFDRSPATDRQREVLHQIGRRPALSIASSRPATISTMRGSRPLHPPMVAAVSAGGAAQWSGGSRPSRFRPAWSAFSCSVGSARPVPRSRRRALETRRGPTVRP